MPNDNTHQDIPDRQTYLDACQQYLDLRANGQTKDAILPPAPHSTFSNDIKVMRMAVWCNGHYAQFCSPKLLDKLSFCLNTISHWESSHIEYRYFSDAVKQNKKVTLAALTTNWLTHLDTVDFVPAHLLEDHEVARNFLRFCEEQSDAAGALEKIKLLPELIRHNFDFSLNYYLKHHGRIEFVHESLLKDENFIKAILKNSGKQKHYLTNTPGFSDHREIMLLAVKNNGNNLSDAAARLKNDPEVVRLAVAQNGYALRHASTPFQDDYETVKLAVTDYGDAIEFASDRLRDNYDLAMIAVKNSAKWGRVLKYLSARLQADPAISLVAIEQDPHSFMYSKAPEVRYNLNHYLAAVKAGGYMDWERDIPQDIEDYIWNKIGTPKQHFSSNSSDAMIGLLTAAINTQIHKEFKNEAEQHIQRIAKQKTGEGDEALLAKPKAKKARL